ncbi:hypothetical protein Fmac_016752 [Flemingia macrophylla]|uniref:Uncharacterized protein n=1 Tax=Flemingia macrophylla TaxID=520843 RepID=A0ABD1MIE1_9FABA
MDADPMVIGVYPRVMLWHPLARVELWQVAASAKPLLNTEPKLPPWCSRRWVRLMVGSSTPFSRTSSNLGSSLRSIGLATTSRCLHHAHRSVAVNCPATSSMVDLLSENDLCSISTLRGLLVFCPIDSSFSHKNALQCCVEHAKIWLTKYDQPIGPNVDVAYECFYNDYKFVKGCTAVTLLKSVAIEVLTSIQFCARYHDRFFAKIVNKWCFAEVNVKIRKAYFPLKVLEGNPCLEYIKYPTLPWFNVFTVERSEDNVHPTDYCKSLSDYRCKSLSTWSAISPDSGMAGMAAPPLTLPIGMAAPPLTLPTNHDNIDRAAGILLRHYCGLVSRPPSFFSQSRCLPPLPNPPTPRASHLPCLIAARARRAPYHRLASRSRRASRLMVPPLLTPRHRHHPALPPNPKPNPPRDPFSPLIPLPTPHASSPPPPRFAAKP